MIPRTRPVHLPLALLCAAAPALAQNAPPPDAAKDDEQRGLRHVEDGAFDGLTLIAPLNSHAIHLVEMDGSVVHTWNTGLTPGGETEMQPDGKLWRCARKPDNPRFHGGGIGGWIHELDMDGNITWTYELADAQRTQHHDFARMPNGNVLVIAWEYHSPDEARARGRDPRFVHTEGLWADVVLEIEPIRPVGGKVVWTWRTWDHLVQDLDPKAANHGKPSDHPGRIDVNADHRFRPVEETPEARERRLKLEEQMRAVGYAGGDDPVDRHAPDAAQKDGAKDGAKKDAPKGPKIEADWLHTNSIDYWPEQDLIVLSVPHMSEIWVIDHGTTTEEAAATSGGKRGRGGELLYRWGNPRNYGRGGASDQRLRYQHDARWIPAPAGETRLLVFDNNEGEPPNERSRVEELVLPFDAKAGFRCEPAAAFGPTTLAWSYEDGANFHSPFISGAQRLPNGNTLVCEGAKGRVFEVRHDGRVVWDFWSPLGGEVEPSPQGGKAPPKALFRAQRIARDRVALPKAK